MLKISVDTRAVERLTATVSKQLAFAVSKAMNETVKAAQAAERAALPGKFTLRRKPWVEQSIKISTFAKKTALTAVLEVDPTRNVLAKFEAGGDKVGRSGGRVAIPIDVRRNKSDIVPRTRSVRALLASGKAYVQNGLVLERLGSRRSGHELRLAYLLKRSVRIRPRLGLVATTRQTFADEFSTTFAKAFADALRTAK